MGQKLSQEQKELYRRVDEILTYVWDPIGVSKVPTARDEYQGYLPQVFKLIIENKSSKIIAEYLSKIEEELMGMPNWTSIEDTIEIAELLIEHYDWIKQKK